MQVSESHVELVDHMGTDLSVVNAARVSFNKMSQYEEQDLISAGFGDWGGPFDYDKIKAEGWDILPNSTKIRRLKSGDKKLIQYLATHNHWTVFGHCAVSLRVTVPIFVARQLGKHQVGLVQNEISRRYIDDEPEFYIPEVWRGAPENKKQGSSSKVIKLNKIYNMEGNNGCILTPSEIVEHSLETYNVLIELGVAPEQARIILPQNMMTSYIWTGSLYAWARINNLRVKPDAQQETRDVAEMFAKIIEPLYPVSWKALTSVKHDKYISIESIQKLIQENPRLSAKKLLGMLNG